MRLAGISAEIIQAKHSYEKHLNTVLIMKIMDKLYKEFQPIVCSIESSWSVDLWDGMCAEKKGLGYITGLGV